MTRTLEQKKAVLERLRHQLRTYLRTGPYETVTLMLTAAAADPIAVANLSHDGKLLIQKMVALVAGEMMLELEEEQEDKNNGSS